MPAEIVADRPRQRDRLAAHLFAERRVDGRRRRLLDDLLVPPLQRAFALAEVDDVAVPVAEDLHLDVTRTDDVFLDEDALVAEGRARLRAGPLPAFFHLRRARRDAHALAAAAGGGLDHHRKADGLGNRDRFGGIADRAEMAGDRGDARRRGELLRFDLVAHRRDRPRIRPDEDDAGGGERLGEGGPLRQEPVARMHRLGAGPAAGVDDLLDHEVGRRRRRRTDVNRLVGHLDMRRRAVDVAIYGDRGDPHPPGGADDADGDLAAIGDQDLVEQTKKRLPVGRNSEAYSAYLRKP